MIKTFTKFNEDEELSDFEEDLIVEKAPVTADAMKRYKAGRKLGFTDKAHLKAKGLNRADGSKVKSDKYKEKK